ncbi:MAG: thiol-disulfide oxidoreductase DCC family protein, partial [Limisphaerales bacterium]
MTEITEHNGAWLFYDGKCRFCVGTLQTVKPLLARREIRSAPLQEVWVQKRLALDETNLLEEMKFLDARGRVHGGADALLAMARLFWWAWPFFFLGQLPGVKPVLRFVYRKFAAKRYCLSGTCDAPAAAQKRVPVTIWMLAIFFPVVTLPLANILPAWGFMWALAATMFLGYKGLTWYAPRTPQPKTLKHAARYFLLWPGMEPEPFLAPPRRINVNGREWIFALAKIALGIVLFWLVARQFAPTHPIL